VFFLFETVTNSPSKRQETLFGLSTSRRLFYHLGSVYIMLLSSLVPDLMLPVLIWENVLHFRTVVSNISFVVFLFS
jgi:hypothetical protein